MSDEPPWRDVTTADYHQRTFAHLPGHEAWIAKDAAAHAIIRGQVDGLYRIRLVLFEVTDMVRHPKRPPLWIFDYDIGTDAMATTADEVVIVTRDGRRHVVQRRTPAEAARG